MVKRGSLMLFLGGKAPQPLNICSSEGLSVTIRWDEDFLGAITDKMDPITSLRGMYSNLSKGPQYFLASQGAEPWYYQLAGAIDWNWTGAIFKETGLYGGLESGFFFEVTTR